MLISDNDAHQMELDLELDPVTQAISQAQEQLHISMEAQHQEDQLQWWMEKDWEVQMEERDRVVVSDKELAVEAAVVAEIGKRCCKVILGLSLAIFGILT